MYLKELVSLESIKKGDTKVLYKRWRQRYIRMLHNKEMY